VVSSLFFGKIIGHPAKIPRFNPHALGKTTPQWRGQMEFILGGGETEYAKMCPGVAKTA